MSDFKNNFLEWLDFERSNKKRLGWGLAFLISGIIVVGVLLIKINLIHKITDHLFELFWVIGSSSVGIGVGLINERLKEKHEEPRGRDDQHFHYVIYYLLLALFISSLAAYAVGRHDKGAFNYPLSALIGLTVGFVARKINEWGPIK